jgi:hypothetical protein
MTPTNDAVRGADKNVEAIEAAFVAHWSLFGRWSQGTLHDDEGVLWFETPIKHLPFNMVMKSIAYPGRALVAMGVGIDDPDACYLWEGQVVNVWPMNAEGQFLGEDSYIVDDGMVGIADRKIDPSDIVLVVARHADGSGRGLS